MQLKRWERHALILLSVALVAVISAMSFLGGGYFFIPFVLAALFVSVATWLLLRRNLRDPLAMPPIPPHDERLRAEEESRKDAEERLAAKEVDRHDEPRGEIGPPPNVPFP